MKNLFIISGNAKTIAWFRLEMLQEFIDRGYKVFALVPEFDIETRKILEEKGIEIIRISLQRKSFNFINLIQGIFEIKAHIKDLKPDIVFTYMHKSIIASSLAVGLSDHDIRLFSIVSGLGHLFERNQLKYRIFSLASKILFKLSFRYNQKVFFQNQDDKDFFQNSNIISPNKAKLVNVSGVNTEDFNYSQIPQQTVFMTMARLLESKGLREFAKAAKIVKKDFPRSRFIICGYPDLHSDSISEEEIKDLWEPEYGIEYYGYADDPTIVYKLTSVYVLLSYREGIPRTVLEAMSMGRPIITTDVPGCRETVVDGHNGYLVPCRSINKAAQAMMSLMDRKTQIEMGKKSREMARSKFDVKRVNASILDEVFKHH